MSLNEVMHTADIKIQVCEPTLELLFSKTFEAMMQVMYGNIRRRGISKEIRIESHDNESLLVDFLSEVLFMSEVEGIVFLEAHVSISGTRLVANLNGEIFDPIRHSGGSEIKGISYSGLSINCDANGYSLDIIFDV